MFNCLSRYFDIWVLPSPFLAWQRSRCLIGGCFEAVGVVGVLGTPTDRADIRVVEDQAERRPNMRNKSSILRYRGVYLVYRSATVRQIPYVGGEGEISRYLGVSESVGDGAGEGDA